MLSNEISSISDAQLDVEELFIHRPFERLFHSSSARIVDFFLIFKEFDYSEADIARKTHLSQKTVSKELDNLVEEGILRITRRSGKSNMYKLDESKKVRGFLQYVDDNMELASTDLMKTKT